MKAVLENTMEPAARSWVEIGVGTHGGAPGGRVRIAIGHREGPLQEAWIDRDEFLHAALMLGSKVASMNEYDAQDDRERLDR